MQTTTQTHLEGYRSLFDPNFVPAVIVGRNKEFQFIRGFLIDNMAIRSGGAPNDHYGASILVNGLHGIGKSTLVRKVIADLETEVCCEKQPAVENVFINCTGKTEAELLMDLVGKLAIELSMPPDSLPDMAGIWSAIRARAGKLAAWSYYNVCFDNMESIPVTFLSKVSSGLKNLGINLLFTSTIRNDHVFVDNLDVSVDLDVYSTQDLETIVSQRVEVAFSTPAPALSRLVTDAVVEFDSPRPGTCINILKYLYPRANTGGIDSVSLADIQECARNALSGMSFNELDLTEFFSDASIAMLMFVDNIATFFARSETFYITRKELHNLYFEACECIENGKSADEFEAFVASLLEHSILFKSSREPSSFFSMIPATFLKNYLDEVLA
jgi:hypothetical protein